MSSELTEQENNFVKLLRKRGWKNSTYADWNWPTTEYDHNIKTIGGRPIYVAKEYCENCERGGEHDNYVVITSGKTIVRFNDDWSDFFWHGGISEPYRSFKDLFLFGLTKAERRLVLNANVSQ